MGRKGEFCDLCQGYDSDGSDHAVRKSVKPAKKTTDGHGRQRPASTEDDECRDCGGVDCMCEDDCDCSDWSSASDSEAEHENVEEAPAGGDLDHIDYRGQVVAADSDIEPEDESSQKHEDSYHTAYDENVTFVVRGKRASRNHDDDFEEAEKEVQPERKSPVPKASKGTVSTEDNDDKEKEENETSERDNNSSSLNTRIWVRRHWTKRTQHEEENEDKIEDDKDNADKVNAPVKREGEKKREYNKPSHEDSDAEEIKSDEEDNKFGKRHSDYTRRGRSIEKRETQYDSDDEHKLPSAIEEFIEKKNAANVEAVYGRSGYGNSGGGGGSHGNYGRNYGGRSRRPGRRYPMPQAPAGKRKRRHLFSKVKMPTGKKFWVSIPAAEKTNWKCYDKTKLITLRPRGKMGRREYTIIAKEMEKTRRNHISGKFNGYKILKLQKIVNPCLWKKYRHRRRDVMSEGPANEQMLFHGSPAYKDLINKGFDERYANKAGMFGAGLYFAKNSSKSNQYVFGLNGPCPTHKNKHCLVCERVMILCRVTLGKVQTYTKENQRAHPPVGFHSVEGIPSSGGLQYSENIIYRGEQVYPEFLITYKLKP